MEWEYNSIYLDCGFMTDKNPNNEQINEMLNEQGKEGWELVNTLDIGTPSVGTHAFLFIFKRPELIVTVSR